MEKRESSSRVTAKLQKRIFVYNISADITISEPVLWYFGLTFQRH